MAESKENSPSPSTEPMLNSTFLNVLISKETPCLASMEKMETLETDGEKEDAHTKVLSTKTPKLERADTLVIIDTKCHMLV